MLELMQEFDDMFSNWGIFSNLPKLHLENDLETQGLKKIIGRPHNLYTNKDKDGKITSYGLSIVYTPFKKSDVHAKVVNGNLCVECGTENKVDEKTDSTVYRGISNQSYKFSFPLSESIDCEKITAKAEDGVLEIDMPVKKELEVKEDVIELEIK